MTAILSSLGRPLPALAARWIAHFHMERIPQEGAWFSPGYTSDEVVASAALPVRYGGERRIYNSIHCVQTRDDFSGIHRLKTDEYWHFYDGDPVELLLLHPDGRGETVRLGPDVFAGERRQFLVPRDVWQGARPLGGDDACALIGNSMAPAFDYADFEIGYREELQAKYPDWAGPIAALTRDEHARRPAGG